MTFPPELAEFARTWFTLAGGDPSTWASKVELGLQGTAIGAAFLALLVAVVAIASRERGRG
jgi:hypothetical protein